MPHTASRYLVYELLGKVVNAFIPERLGGGAVQGTVEKVGRDIFNRTIEIRIGSEYLSLREPLTITMHGNTLSFLYDDEETVAMNREVSKAEGKRVKRTASQAIFEISGKVRRRKPRWRLNPMAPA
jgi:hypothetical protein